MHIMTAWQILGLTPTRDKRAINKAYAGRLRETRPDEDPEGFARLVKARACALAAASTPFFLRASRRKKPLLSGINRRLGLA